MADYLDVVYNNEARPLTTYPQKLCKHLFGRFGMKAGMKLLEPGCGRCEFLHGFSELGVDAYGYDLSPKAPEFGNGLPIKVGDIEKDGLPYVDDTFDVVYTKSVLEHLYHPDKYLEEALRVLKPGGLLLTLVPDWEANYKTYFDDFTHRSPFTRVALEDIYKMCGFEAVKVHIFRQLPIVWKFPFLNGFCAAISPFIPVRTKIKFFRWSRELMLIGTGRKLGKPE